MASYAKVKPITADTTTNFRVVHGWHFTETTAAAGASIQFRRTDASGEVLLTITLAANETAWENYHTPLYLDEVLHVEVLSGSVQGSVFGG